MVEAERAEGVMTDEYSEQRQENLPLVYRYRVRASMTVRAYRRYHPDVDEPEVLDLGAADGKTLLEMRDRLGGHGRYTGVELSESLLGRVPELPADTRVIEGDVMSLPESLEAGSFDLCSALAVLEHLPDPVACIEEAYRMLRPGGVFVASAPAPFWDRLAGTLGLVEDEYHQQEVTLDVMASWAREAGFQHVRTMPFMWCVTGFLPYLGVSVSPARSLRIDEGIRKIDPTNLSFVNQALIARKSP